MSFREKIHWVAFLSLILGFGWYFLSYPWAVANTRGGMLTSVWMLIPTTIIFLVPMVAGTTLFAMRQPKTASKERKRGRGDLQPRNRHPKKIFAVEP